MGRKQDINIAASVACLAVAAIVGFATQSFWVGLIAFVVFVRILSAKKIIR